jgi:hypothetical protein
VGGISAGNSLIGQSAGDLVSDAGVSSPNEGSYIVQSPSWDDPSGPTVNAGALTFGDAFIGTRGRVGPDNSVVGKLPSGLTPASFDYDAVRARWIVGRAPSNEIVVVSMSPPTGCPGDPDCDGIATGSDNCPAFRTANTADTDANGLGNPCECGDQTGDGRVNVQDLVAINLAIFTPGLATPLCDTNADGLCNVQDIVGANLRIFGQPAHCARNPQ